MPDPLRFATSAIAASGTAFLPPPGRAAVPDHDAALVAALAKTIVKPGGNALLLTRASSSCVIQAGLSGLSSTDQSPTSACGHDQAARVLLGSWRCRGGNSVHAFILADGDPVRRVELEWDAPPPLSGTVFVGYITLILPAMRKRAQEYLERQRRALVVVS